MAKNLSVWIEAVPDTRKFPSLAGEITTDVVVIGGGIVGVTTAFQLLKKGKRVVLLEKNHIATGDSGLSTGFITRVPDTSLVSLSEKYGSDFVSKIFEATRSAQLWIFDMIKRHGISCDFSQCDEYIGSYEEEDDVISSEFEAFKKTTAQGELVEGNKPNFPFKKAIKFPNEGKFNPRKYIFSLLELMKGEAFRVFEETEALEVDTRQDIRVKTPGGNVKAKYAVIATDQPMAFFSEFQKLLIPMLTYVMTARYAAPPLTEDLFADTFDPYFYYRKIDADTIMLGGSDIEAAKAHSQNPFEKLESFLQEHFPGEYEITNRWSGSLFDTEDGLPYAFSHPHENGRVFVGTGFGGNGLVFGTLTAHILADLITGTPNKYVELLSLQRTKTSIPKPVRVFTAAPAAAGAASKKQFVASGKVSDFGNKTMMCKIVSGVPVGLFKIEGKFYAIKNTCSHAGGSLCDGTLEGKTIECPLHGAKFDVTTGQVMGPPAVRNQESYACRVSGDLLEVEIPIEAPRLSAAPTTKQATHWKQLFSFSGLAVAFWLAQFATQYFWLSKNDIGSSLIRSFGLAGATLISFALFSSALFKWIPRLAVHWRIRRYLGVSGFILAVFHVLTVLHFLFDYDLASVYVSWNPLKNPVVFSTIAFPILLVMAATSTDWAVNKLTPKVWKFIHRFVYLAYWGIVFHFLRINPALLKNPPAYFLIAIICLTLFGELFWFIKLGSKKRFISVAGAVGIFIILLYLITFYVVYWK